MIGAAVRADLTKVKRTWIIPLVFLGPTGVLSINALRYALRYHGLVVPGGDNWQLLVNGVNSLLIPSLVIGVAILASIAAGLEHRGRMWKQFGATAVRPQTLYIAKFLVLAALLAFAGLLCALGAAGMGWLLGFGSPPWGLLASEGFGPYLAAYGLIGLQLALSVLVPNRVIAVTVGIAGMIMSLMGSLVPAWLPWRVPSLAAPLPLPASPGPHILYGLVLGALALGIGAVLFARQDRP